MPVLSDDLVYYFSLATFATLVVLVCLGLSLAISRIRFSGARGLETDASADLAERTPLSLDQFYEKFYTGQAPRVLVAEIVSRFAQAAHVRACYLRPEDSFVSLGAAAEEDAQQFAVDSATLMQQAEERAGIGLFSGHFVTLDDYIRGHAIAERFTRQRQ